MKSRGLSHNSGKFWEGVYILWKVKEGQNGPQ